MAAQKNCQKLVSGSTCNIVLQLTMNVKRAILSFHLPSDTRRSYFLLGRPEEMKNLFLMFFSFSDSQGTNFGTAAHIK